MWQHKMCESDGPDTKQLPEYRMCLMSNLSPWCEKSRSLFGEFIQRRHKRQQCDSRGVFFASSPAHSTQAPPLARTKASSYSQQVRMRLTRTVDCCAPQTAFHSSPTHKTSFLFLLHSPAFSPSSVCLSPSHIFSPFSSLPLPLLTLYSTVLSMTLHFTTRASCSSTLPGGQLAFFTTHQGYCPGLCVCLCVCRCVFVWSQSHQVYCGG